MASSINFLGYPAHALRCHHGIEVEAGDPVGYQLFALLDAPFDAHFPGIVVGFAFAELRSEGFGYLRAEDTRQYRQLVPENNRFDTRYDGDGNPFRPATLHEGEVFRIVEKHLRNQVVGPVPDLLLQVENV